MSNVSESKGFEALTTDREFMEKLNETKSYEEAKELFAAEGVDLDYELSGADEEGELSEESLENVAGGITWKQAKAAWDFGLEVGVVIRNVWDIVHRQPLSYPNWRFQWQAKYFWIIRSLPNKKGTLKRVLFCNKRIYCCVYLSGRIYFLQASFNWRMKHGKIIEVSLASEQVF